MSGSTLSHKIGAIMDDYNNLSISELKHRISPLITEIRELVSERLFKKFMIEYDCVKNECIYGDNDEDTEMVKYDIIKVLKTINNEINNLM
jgi:uncharacterized small protein (DUF1192 family)